MRNMKILHIFQIYVIKEKRDAKEHFGNVKNTKANVTQRSPWNSIYVTFSFVRKVGTYLLLLFIDQLMREDYSPHSL